MNRVRDYYAEEVEFLRSLGSSDAEITRALGVTPRNLARALYRVGRPDLARPFGRIEKRERAS